METRHREFQKLKKGLLDNGHYVEGMDVQCMREILHDLHCSSSGGEIREAEKQKNSRSLKTKNLNHLDIGWSPQWLRDESSSRLKRKEKSQPTSVANTSTNNRLPRVEYGRVLNNCNTIPSKNGNMSTKQKGSTQAAGRYVAAFSPAVQIQNNNNNSPILVSVNHSPRSLSKENYCDQQKSKPMPSKTDRIFNSTLKKSSRRADDGCHMTLPNFTMNESPSQAAGRFVAAFSPGVQIQDTNSPILVSVNCSPQSLGKENDCDQQKTKDMPPKTDRIFNSTLKKSSRQADDGCHMTLPSFTMNESPSQAAGRSVAAFSPAVQIQDTNSPILVSVNCSPQSLRKENYCDQQKSKDMPPKTDRTFVSTLKKSANWHSQWRRAECRRLERITTDFNCNNSSEKRNTSNLRCGASHNETISKSPRSSRKVLNPEVTNNSASLKQSTIYNYNDDDEDVDRLLSSSNSADLTEEPYVSNISLICDGVDRSQTISFEGFLLDDGNLNISFSGKDLSTLYEMDDESSVDH